MKKPKQVIVMRTDLNMRRGKMIAQGAHASLGAVLKGSYDTQPIDTKTRCIPMGDELLEWLSNGSFTKIGLGCQSEEELLDIYKQAEDSGLRVCLITDSGRTEFNNVPTNTCLAIGPNWSEEIDKITGDLKLI